MYYLGEYLEKTVTMFLVTECSTITSNFGPATHREETAIKLRAIPDVLNGDNVRLL